MTKENWLEAAQLAVLAAGIVNTSIHPSFEAALTIVAGIIWIAFTQWLEREQIAQLSYVKSALSELQAELNQLATRVNDAKFLVNMKRGQ